MAYRRDSIFTDGDVARKGRVACSVDDPPALDEDVEILRSGGRCGQQETQDNKATHERVLSVLQRYCGARILPTCRRQGAKARSAAGGIQSPDARPFRPGGGGPRERGPGAVGPAARVSAQIVRRRDL